MRILLAIHNAYTDSTSGAAQSMRILTKWLCEGGHDCRVLGTGRFDARPPDDFDAHLAELGVPLHRASAPKAFVRSVKKPANMVVGRSTVDFVLDGVPVTTLVTRAQRGSPAEHYESEQFLFHLDDYLHRFQPDVLLTYGGHPLVQETMRRARRGGARCVFSLRSTGYEDRRHFEYVDSVLTASVYLSRLYREAIGLNSTGIDSPIDWEEVVAPDEMRQYVTFVNPLPSKGVMLFARLADMLGSARPDIPLLIVQSAASAGALNSIPGLDFGKYPQIMVAPATMKPADFFALTKILLVPTVVRESFGRVAAEALINGIPPLVSNRGALPETVHGAGRVLPLPDSLTDQAQMLPSSQDVQPWFDAVCELWDDADAYARASTVARDTAARFYSEPIVRQRYLDYFASLDKHESLFDPP
jgi:glycosyltransferase involved in cell wall biosynthesis